MSKYKKVLFLGFISFCITCIPLCAQVRLPKFVGDNMVLQRDAKIRICGWASQGEKVTVTFRGKNFKATTGSDGKWAVTLPPTKAGGPFEMTVAGSNKITIKDILVGDVWFCSGQSNMVHYLELHKERYAEEIAKANYPQIRQLFIPTLTDLRGPAQDLPEVAWKTATSPDIGRFSVVGYFFAKTLHEKYAVPIGIINASVGGTPIEAWTSEDGLKEFPELTATITKNKDTAYVNSTNRAAANAAKERAALKKTEDKGMTGPKKWFDPTYVPKNWYRINIPGYWEDQGVRDLDGVVWYRKEINLPASMEGAPARVALGRIVDADYLYVNGTQVGHTGYQYPQRRYQIPAGVLKAGKNIFVVRVINEGGKGGFVPDKPYYLAVNNDTIDLKGYWHYKVGEVYARNRGFGGGISAQNQPSALFNAMVAPFINYPVKGFVWYQGESNAGKPSEYNKFLPALIADWRKQWQQPNAPFLYAQLPNFMEANYSPSESNWAILREAQLNTLRIPNTGMAVTIDLGEWNDIHPSNKKPIGDRLALAAQRLAYGDNNVVYSGPLVESYKIEGNKIIISFKHTGSGLVSIDGEPLSQFAIAGKDKKFVWAQAEIQANTVVVWNEDIAEPAYVRYAWADNPVGANLYNKEGLPASPFRTDQ